MCTTHQACANADRASEGRTDDKQPHRIKHVPVLTGQARRVVVTSSSPGHVWGPSHNHTQLHQARLSCSMVLQPPACRDQAQGKRDSLALDLRPLQVLQPPHLRLALLLRSRLPSSLLCTRPLPPIILLTHGALNLRPGCEGKMRGRASKDAVCVWCWKGYGMAGACLGSSKQQPVSSATFAPLWCYDSISASGCPTATAAGTRRGGR